MKKKCLALLLALCLGCSLLPAPAFAVSDVAVGSKEYKELESFLGLFYNWIQYYDAEGAFVTADPEMPEYDHSNIFEALIREGTGYCYDDSLYPGEDACWNGTDPLGKWWRGSCLKANAQKIDWLLKNVFNCSDADIARLKASVLTVPVDSRANISASGYNYFGKNWGNSEECLLYYLDGYYYSCLGGVGGLGYTLSIKDTKKTGGKYLVKFNSKVGSESFDDPAPPVPCYALVERKTVNGKGYWSLYYLSELKDGQDPLNTGGFIDVASNAYYREPILWAIDQGITYGTGWASFSPDATCTKGQILTFLWRAQGQPKPSGANPFQDVSSGDYFYQAALWAAEKGLVSGPSFQGGAPCTRAMTVSYLWKLAGSPAASGASFGDVPAGTDTAQAVAWAVDEGIAYGTGNGKFSPNATCTRGQIVTFLYRAD